MANHDSVRFDMYFGKTKAEENKKAFDYLQASKEKIENAIGAHLIWKRGDDIKSSRISYELKGVNIFNEIDWLQMTRFLAEWSKKFYDVMVPYVTEFTQREYN